IARFLGDSRYRIETDVCEENDGRSGLNSGPAVGKEGMKVVGLRIRPANDYEEAEDDQLQDHHPCIQRGAFANSDDEDDGDERDDAERENVEDNRNPENVRRVFKE